MIREPRYLQRFDTAQLPQVFVDVLVIGPEATLTSVLASAFEERGLNTAECHDGRDAFTRLTAEDGRRGLEIFRARAGEIDCVVLDLTMPGLDGEEVFREITAIKPEMPVLLASGYTEEELAKRFEDHY